MEKILFVEELPIIVAGMNSILQNNGITDIELKVADSILEMEKKLFEEEFQIIIIGIHLNAAQWKNLSRIMDCLPFMSIIVFAGIVNALPERNLYKSKLCGILDKSDDEKEIIKAIKQARNGQAYISQRFLKELLYGKNMPGNLKNLTEREHEIARLLANGKRNQQISEVLDLRPSTISTFKTKIFKKLKVRNIVELERLIEEYS